jgi:hypothetical protein
MMSKWSLWRDSYVSASGSQGAGGIGDDRREIILTQLGETQSLEED